MGIMTRRFNSVGAGVEAGVGVRKVDRVLRCTCEVSQDYDDTQDRPSAISHYNHVEPGCGVDP